MPGSSVTSRLSLRAIESWNAFCPPDFLFAIGAFELGARDRVATIDFFGYQGVDTAAIERGLPFHVGDRYIQQKTEAEAREAVARVTGKAATEVGAVCCDDGDYHIFIGVAGASSKAMALHPKPGGTMRLAPATLVDLLTRLDEASEAAVKAGRAQEDDSEGYALSLNDPASRALELKVREYALAHERDVYAVLAGSADAQHRQWAADAAGYGRQSAEQVAALLAAGRDVHQFVRNEAVRALGCLAGKPGASAKLMAPDLFLEMMNSGIWSDRNKGSWVLISLAGDEKVATRLRAEARDPIIEMARWKSRAHAGSGVMLFARMAGVPVEEAEKASVGPLAGLLGLLERR